MIFMYTVNHPKNIKLLGNGNMKYSPISISIEFQGVLQSINYLLKAGIIYSLYSELSTN